MRDDPAPADKVFPDSRQVDDICRALAGVLPRVGVSVLAQDTSLVYRWAQNLPEGWLPRSPVGLTDAELLDGAEAEALAETKRKILGGAAPVSLEVVLEEPAPARWFRVTICPRFDRDGGVDGVLTLLEDITDVKRRERTLSALMREVSHRSKNLLAIILSIANQTGRHAGSTETFVERFRGRLQSLAASQDLITSSNWSGASLRKLVMAQTARYAPDRGKRLAYSGSDPRLLPNAALHIGLGLHELAVNSSRFGAFSGASGSVSISVEPTTQESEIDGFSLEWREEVAPDASQADRRFGSIMLERVVPAAVDGAAGFSIADGILSYRLDVPEREYEPE